MNLTLTPSGPSCAGRCANRRHGIGHQIACRLREPPLDYRKSLKETALKIAVEFRYSVMEVIVMTPDQQLAAMIVEELLVQNLVVQDDANDVRDLLAEGTASPEDWNSWVEAAIESAVTEQSNGSN